MKRIVKLLLGLVLAAVVLLVLAAVLLPMVYDTEDLKQTLATKVREQTGRDFTIEGDLDFSVFPSLAVTASGMTLGNAPGFGPEPMVRVRDVSAGVQLLPLLRREIRIDEIWLKELQLSLAVNAAGQANWGNLLGKTGTGGGADRRGAFDSQTIDGLNIDGARVEYRNAQDGDYYLVEELNLETGPLGRGAFPFEVSFSLRDSEAGSATDLRLAGEATADLARPALDLTNARLELGDGTFGLEAPEITVDLADETLQIPDFQAASGDLEASGELSVSNLLGEPAYSGRLVVAQFSPRKAMRRLGVEPPETTDPEVLGRARLSTDFTGSLSALTLSGLDMQLDESRLKGRFEVRDFAARRIRFDLDLDQFDADRYLPPAQEPSDADPDMPVALPTGAIAGQDIRGFLRISRLRIMGVELADARAELVLENDRLRLDPLTASVYGGRYSGNIGIDASTETPAFSVDQTLESIAFQQLASDLLGRGDLSGTVSGHVRLTGQAGATRAMLESLDGNTNLNLNDGALEGVDLWYEVRRAMAVLKREKVPVRPADPRTVFSRLGLRGSLVEGMLLVDDLQGELPFLTFGGSGGIDLLQRALEIDLRATVRQTPEIDQDPLVADLQGKSLPLTLSGSLAAPSVGVDVKNLLKDEATDRLLDKLSGPKDGDGGEKSSKEKAVEALKGLLQRKDESDDGGG